MTVGTKMVVRAVSVIFLSVYLMAGNHLTVSAANGEKISEDSDFSVSGENMDSLLNSLDLSRIEAFLREAGGSAVPGLSFREILSMLLSGNYQSVVRMMMDFCRTALFREISENGRWMGQVILLGILGAVFASFSSLFADSQVSEMGFYVTYLLIFTLLAASFLNGVRITRTLLEQLFEFVRVLVPAFFLAVSFSGGSTSAAAGYAWTLASVNVAEWVFLQLFLPCTQLYVLLSLAGHLSSKDLFSKALELLEQGMRWGSKALLGVVLGFHVLQGMIAPYTDSVRQTALRRAVSLIPGIGQGAAAVSQVLLGSSVLIRNTVGIGGVLVLAAVSLLPLLKLLILYLGCQEARRFCSRSVTAGWWRQSAQWRKDFIFAGSSWFGGGVICTFDRGGVCEHERGLFCGVEDGSNYSLGGEYRQLSSVSDRSDRAFART
ncbi:MAG: stage III sporulation protein AE [Clostridium fessum]